MKQSVYILILLLLISSVSALSVELISPPNSAVYVDSNSINFKCKTIGNDLIQLRLYTDISGSWDITDSVSPPTNNTEITFLVPDINNGNYKWNCKSISGSGNAWAPSNRTFTVNYENSAPTFSGPIPNQTWNKDSSLSDAFDLDTYFSDPESDPIIYSVSGNSNINVQIASDNKVSFSQPSEWWGTEKITFKAAESDTKYTLSNEITLTVTQTTCTEDWTCTDWSDCEDEEQTRTCTDNNDCGTTDNKPSESRSCDNGCTEDWECTTWSSCIDGYQTRDCTDDNDCGTTDDKPSESKTCSSSYMLEITSSSPSSSSVTMLRGTSKTFTIDTNLMNPDIEWYLNDKLQTETSESYRYSPTSSDIGTHKIKVVVQKDNDVDAKEWTVTVNEPTTISAVTCGNNKIDANETCLSCPADAGCLENETCDEGICKSKGEGIISTITGFTSSITDTILDKWYYSAIIAGLILLTIIGFMISSKKPEKSPLSQFEEKKPLLGRIRKNLREWDRKRQKQKQNKEKVKQLEKERKEEIHETVPIDLNSIITFINESSSKGYSKWQIIRALRKRGWSRQHIGMAFERAKK